MATMTASLRWPSWTGCTRNCRCVWRGGGQSGELGWQEVPGHSCSSWEDGVGGIVPEDQNKPDGTSDRKQAQLQPAQMSLNSNPERGVWQDLTVLGTGHTQPRGGLPGTGSSSCCVLGHLVRPLCCCS